MSALPPKAGITQHGSDVRIEPPQFRRALMPTMSATRWLPARCHLTCTTVPTLTSHHEPCAPSTTNRVLSVTWYVQARRLRAAVKVRAASSRAVTVPPPLGDPK